MTKDGLQSSPERLKSFSSSKPHSLAIVPPKPLKCRSQALSLTSPTSSLPSPSSTPSSLLGTTALVAAEMDEGVQDGGSEEGACHNFCLGQNASCFLRSDPFIFLIYEDTDEKNVVGGQLVTEDNLFDYHRESGQAECECPESRTGSRCEVDPCSNFCLPHSTACRCLSCKFDMLTT